MYFHVRNSSTEFTYNFDGRPKTLTQMAEPKKNMKIVQKKRSDDIGQYLADWKLIRNTRLRYVRNVKSWYFRVIILSVNDLPFMKQNITFFNIHVLS